MEVRDPQPFRSNVKVVLMIIQASRVAPRLEAGARADPTLKELKCIVGVGLSTGINYYMTPLVIL